MNEPPALDPEAHEDDTVVSVWKRRMVLILLIVLVVAVAAPTFGGCSGFFDSKKVVATFEAGGRTHEVDERGLHDFMRRYNMAMRLFPGPQGGAQMLPDGEEGVKSALHIRMIDEAAKAEGVEVPDAVVTDTIRSHPYFQVAGKFDEARYRSVLNDLGRGELEHKDLAEILRMDLRRQHYEQIFGTAFELVPGQDAYESWKKRAAKLTVDFVPSSFELQRAKVEAMQPAEEDLEKLKNRPEVRKILAIPPSKVVEIAYAKASEMTAEQFAAAKKFLEEAEVYTEDAPLEAEAFRLFHENRDIAFTAERWAKWSDPEFPTKLAQYEKDLAEWEKRPKEEKDKVAPPPKPKNPAEDWPGDPRGQFEKWGDQIRKERVAKDLVKHMGQRAEREGKPLSALEPDYARFGVKTAKNAEPLPDDQIVEKFPASVARDSEFDQIVRGRLRAPAEGEAFKRRYHVDEPIPTTRLADRTADRGFMVAVLEQSDPARQYAVADKKVEIVKVWRELQIAEEAKKPLAEIKKEAEAAGTDVAKRQEALRAAAAKQGLPVHSLRRFNSKTEAPKAPAAEPGKTLPPDVEAVAQRINWRNYVQKGYAQLSTMAPGQFVEPHWPGGEVQAAMLVLVVEKHEPAPVEMQDDDVRVERMIAARTARQKAMDLFGFDALAKRFNLQRFDEKPKKDKDEVKAPEKTVEDPPTKK
jgi:hypothetical protein